MVPVVAQMSSLIFGALKDQKDSSKKRQSSYITLRESNQAQYQPASSGEQNSRHSSESSESSLDSQTDSFSQSFFDPPVINYKFSNNGGQKEASGGGTGDKHKGEFKIIRRLKQDQRNSLIGEKSSNGSVVKQSRGGSFSSMITNPEKQPSREDRRSTISDKNDNLDRLDSDDKLDSDSNDSIERERYKISNY